MQGSRKTNNMIVILALIALVGMAGCVWLLISVVTESAGSHQILSDKEREAIGK
jgi:hypothetical protein